MKYTSQIIVEVPIEEFVEKLDNHTNMKHWQQGLISFEHIYGDPGKVGAKMKLNYSIGNREMTLIETITETNLPKSLSLHYDSEGLHHIQKNHFESTQEGHTKWTSNIEFVPTSFKMRLMILILPKAFKKQSMKYLTAFKNFAETGASILNETT